MADNDVLLALGVGAALALAIYVLVNQHQRATANASAPRTSRPALVQHNVMRDEYGRITNVETFRGLEGGTAASGGGGGGAEAPASQPTQPVAREPTPADEQVEPDDEPESATAYGD